jgi:acetoacetyl-CoA synthetase
MRTPLWIPSPERIDRANLTRFMEFVATRHKTSFDNYHALWKWSVTEIAAFWEAFWDFAGIRYSRRYDTVVDDPDLMPGATWFSGARLNFAENLLSRNDDHVALIGRCEHRPPRYITYTELTSQVLCLADSLQQLGVGPTDRIAGYLPNIPETVIGMLAAATLGATWTSTSPDFGESGVLSRFGQTKPTVLITADGYSYNGKGHSRLEMLANLVKELPTLKQVIVVPFLDETPNLDAIPGAIAWQSALKNGNANAVEFAQLPASHPLYIMYSSGTTGLPKCMVQSAGGILVHHLKELMLHTDVQPDDTVFYFTTCGWMMWNWLVSSLGLGASVVLYDGSPFHPHQMAMWEMAEQEGISIFGTGARYLEAMARNNLRPGDQYQLTRLKTVLSTGSPLCKEGYHYVYSALKKDLQLSSICGGTDLNGCLAIGNPLLPVYAGDIQCRPLGMAVDAIDVNREPVRNDKAELVCRKAFPSMPLGFWGDDDGSRYLSAYFERFPGLWHHGDYVMIREDTGGLVVFGRSDTTLNPGGVRIGTAEIYPAVESVPEVEDSLVVGQEWNSDVRIILFVKLLPGKQLTEELIARIRYAIQIHATRRHRPQKVVEVPDIPYTISGKKVELAVRNVIHGEAVSNRNALRNPECLDAYKGIPELMTD